MGARRAVLSPSLSGKHARQGQGRRRAQLGSRRGRPLLYLSEPARAGGRGAAGAGLSSPRAGRDLAGAEPTVIGPGPGAASLSWAVEPRRFHFAPRSRQVSILQERSVPLRRPRRRGPRILAAALRALPSVASTVSGCLGSPRSRRRRRRCHRLGAVPLALVPPMSDPNSRTEKRKVNTFESRGAGRVRMEDWRWSQHGATSSPLPAHVRLEARVFVPRVVRWESVTGAGRVRAAGRGGLSAPRLRALNGSGGDAAPRDGETSPCRLGEAARAPRTGWGAGGSRAGPG